MQVCVLFKKTNIHDIVCSSLLLIYCIYYKLLTNMNDNLVKHTYKNTLVCGLYIYIVIKLIVFYAAEDRSELTHYSCVISQYK